MSLEQQKAAQARALLASPLLDEILSSLEQSAIAACISADLADDRRRADYAAEARAVQRVRGQLEAFTKVETWQPTKVA